MADKLAELVGADVVINRLGRLAQKFPEIIERALYEETLIEMRESMRRTPIDTGALRASHVTEKPQRHGRQITCSIVVGGPAAPYAQIVHEDLDAWHEVGQAKFLESTIMESRPFIAARVAKRIKITKDMF